jgi:hypothetical protein
VLAVLTGEDWAATRFGAPRPIIPRQRRDGSPMFVPSRPAITAAPACDNDRAFDMA